MSLQSIHETQTVATVSDIIGQGEDAHRIVRVGDWEMKAWADDQEPKIRDVDLAKKLQYKELRAIRKLIKRHVGAGDLPEVSRRDTVSRRGIFEENIEEFWLTEQEALFIATQSDTKIAIALTKEMIKVYSLARRGLLPQQTAAMSREEIEQVVQAVLAPMANAIRMIHQYAAHPDRFLPRAELCDHAVACEECKTLISRAAQINRVHWNSIQGELLKAYQIRTYKRLPWTLWEPAREYLFDRIMNPSPNTKVVKTGQLRLIHEKREPLPIVPKITPVSNT